MNRILLLVLFLGAIVGLALYLYGPDTDSASNPLESRNTTSSGPPPASAERSVVEGETDAARGESSEAWLTADAIAARRTRPLDAEARKDPETYLRVIKESDARTRQLAIRAMLARPTPADGLAMVFSILAAERNDSLFKEALDLLVKLEDPALMEKLETIETSHESAQVREVARRIANQLTAVE